MAKSDQVTGNIGLTDALGATRVQPSGMPRRYGGGSRGGSPLAESALGAVEQGIKLIPMAMKAAKDAEYHKMLRELTTETEGWIAKGYKTTRRMAGRSALASKWTKDGISNEQINKVFAAKPVTATIDRDIGGKTMLFDKTTKSRLDSPKPPAIRATDRIVGHIAKASETMPKSMAAINTDIIPFLPKDSEKWNHLPTHASTLINNIHERIEDANVTNLWDGIINLDDLAVTKAEHGNAIKGAIFEAVSFLSSRAIGEMYGRTDNKMTIAAPGVAANAIFADVFRSFRENPDLHKASGISSEDLLNMQASLVGYTNKMSEFFTGKGSALATQNTRLEMVAANAKFSEFIRDKQFLERLRTGNKSQQAIYAMWQKSNTGLISALDKVADMFVIANDLEGFKNFKLSMFDENQQLLNHGEVDNFIEARSNRLNPNSSYWNVRTRTRLRSQLKSTTGLMNIDYQKKLISFTKDYVEDLRSRAKEGEPSAYLKEEAREIDDLLVTYIEKMKKAKKLLDDVK